MSHCLTIYQVPRGLVMTHFYPNVLRASASSLNFPAACKNNIFNILFRSTACTSGNHFTSLWPTALPTNCHAPDTIDSWIVTGNNSPHLFINQLWSWKVIAGQVQIPHAHIALLSSIRWPIGSPRTFLWTPTVKWYSIVSAIQTKRCYVHSQSLVNIINSHALLFTAQFIASSHCVEIWPRVPPIASTLCRWLCSRPKDVVLESFDIVMLGPEVGVV